jgi:hypothetical protein
MNRTDDPLKVVADLRPAGLDRLADDGYARHRHGDLSHVLASDDAAALQPGLPGSWLRAGHERWWHRRADFPRLVRHRTSWPRRAGARLGAVSALLAGAALLAVLAGAAFLAEWQTGVPGAGAAIPVVSPQHLTMRHGAALPQASGQMRLVASTSMPFRAAGQGSTSPALQCVTVAVCYLAPDSSNSPVMFQRTADGGASWHPTAPLPGHWQSAGLSCPTAQICAVPAGLLRLARTTDGGRNWSVQTLPAPARIRGAAIGQVSCATARQCVASVGNSTTGTFMSTVNGGKTWTLASSVPRGAPPVIWALRCDREGRCVALAPVGRQLTALRSADDGRSWAATSVPLPATALVQLDCGDALHCMVLTSWATIAITTTSDGGASWRQTAAPRGWPDIATALSCATGLDCFIAAADYQGSVSGTYEHPAIEATYDGGSAWTTMTLPAGPRSRLAIVWPLSCPSQAGCIGAAATIRQFASPASHRIIISDLPAVGSPASRG